jgi:hypothetical protein
MEPGLGPLPVLKTFGQRAVLRHGGFKKEWVIVPGGRASGLGDGFLVPTPGLLIHWRVLIEEHSRDVTSA